MMPFLLIPLHFKNIKLCKQFYKYKSIDITYYATTLTLHKFMFFVFLHRSFGIGRNSDR